MNEKKSRLYFPYKTSSLMVLCYFAFPPQRHEESSGKIRLKNGFFCFFSFSATAHERKKSGKISGEEQRWDKKRSPGGSLPVPNFRR